MPKDRSGERNSFYGKKHKEESKSKMGGAVVDYSGEKNPFYGKKHTAESIENMKKKLSEMNSGEKNPFHGKKHSKESIDKIIEKNKTYRDLHKEEIIKNRLERKNITREKIESAYNDYSNSRKNADDIQKDISLDKRVFFKYVEYFGIASEEEIKKVKQKKRMNNSKSSPEEKFYKIFCEKYGEGNVIWSHKIDSYFYDFFILDSLLVEYDGYYWHSILCSKNDLHKDNLAKKLGIHLYRIKEDKDRKCDYKLETQKIDEVLNEIQVSRNKIKEI
jgi:hypothetical protein